MPAGNDTATALRKMDVLVPLALEHKRCREWTAVVDQGQAAQMDQFQTGGDKSRGERVARAILVGLSLLPVLTIGCGLVLSRLDQSLLGGRENEGQLGWFVGALLGAALSGIVSVAIGVSGEAKPET